MANEFLSVKSIARQTLPRLIDNLVFPNLIYRDYSSAYENGKGATVQVRKPVLLNAYDFDSANGVTAQDFKEESVEVTLDKLATVDVEFSAVSRATNKDDLDSKFIEGAAAALAKKINDDGLQLYKDVAQFTGMAGSTPSTLACFANAAKKLDDSGVPSAFRRGVWNTAAMEQFRQLGDLVNADKSGANRSLRMGAIGNVFGIENYMSQGVCTHNGGSAAGTLLVDGAVTAGATVIHIDGATSATATVKKGDLLTIAGKQYVCTQDVTFASNEGDVKVYPAVAANIADNTAVTVVQSGAQNLVFHKNAFAFVTRPLAAPAGVESYTTSYNNISLRVVRGYSMKYKTEALSMDVLYGFKTMYPEMAVRVLG